MGTLFIFNMVTFIYTLQSTRNLSDIRYVGKTTQILNKRLVQHLCTAKTQVHRHVCNWIRKELDAGYSITI